LKARKHLLLPLLRHWLRGSAPRRDGEITLRSLQSVVKVSWDAYAIPHVYAQNERDLFLAQGYLHAQERLWQMELTRRSLCGRMAEIFGDRPIPGEISAHLRDKTIADIDYFIRLLGMRRAALASLRCLSDVEMSVLEAYSAGVNRYIEAHLKAMPTEFRLLRFTPEPWRPEDSLTIGKGFAFFLSTSLFTRVAWTALAAKLKNAPEKLASLLPRYPAGAPTITRTAADDANELLRFMSGTFEFFGAAAGQGSNSWVVAPQRSASGGAILCNDPHLKLDLPSTWYLMHLSAPDGSAPFEVWGGTIPGMPCVHIGRNRRIAWGITAGLCDDADLYLENLHPAETDVYLSGERDIPMEVSEEEIRRRRDKPIVKKIRWTAHGPLISDFLRCGALGDKEALAFRWTAHGPSRELAALYGVNRAGNWKEFRAALAHQTAPSLNYVYADCDGNIGYSLAGAVPIRTKRPDYLPLAATDPDSEWKGFIPFEELPALYNPPQGAIATANNDIAGSLYRYHLSDLFEPPYRISRIKELLSAKEKFSGADMAAIQQDTVSKHAQTIVEMLRDDLTSIAEHRGKHSATASMLLKWDADCRADSAAAALFQCFYHHLTLNLLVPTLGPEIFRAYVEIFNQSLVPIEHILRDAASPWFAETPRRALIEASLSEAYEELQRRLGSPAKWGWGKIHALHFNHTLAAVRGLKRFLSLVPLPTGGDGVTINLGFFRRSHPYSHTVGPSLRMIVDLSDAARSRFVIVPGQSGHFFSPHYSNLFELWRTGDYLQLSPDEEPTSGRPLLLIPSA
jgi:penicillin G amidase